MRRRKGLFLMVLTAVLGLGLDAFAVIGRPLTPMSYAGVARRTTRRAVYAGAATGAYGGYGYGYGYGYGGASYMTALPTGCAVGIPCGGVTYQPQYQGTTVVYVAR